MHGGSRDDGSVRRRGKEDEVLRRQRMLPPQQQGKDGVGGGNDDGDDVTEDDDDEVLAEIDVYVTAPEPGTSVTLMQYPTQPRGRPMAPIDGGRIKPVNNLLEVWRPIERGEHYDSDTEDSLKLDRVTHAGHIVPAVTNYVLGVRKGDGLYLSPIHNVMQMRPTFSHMVTPESEDKDLEGEKGDLENTGEELHQIVFKKKESERTQNLRRNSYAHKVQVEESEAWIDLQIATNHDQNLSELTEITPLLQDINFGSARESQAAYIKSMKHLQVEGGAGSSSASAIDLTAEQDLISGGGWAAEMQPAKAAMRHLTGVDSLATYVAIAGIISHKMLKEVSGVSEDEVIIGSLNGRARLLRGNWVTESLHVYPRQDKFSLIRDALLVSLQSYGAVERQRLQDILGISAAAMEKILQEVCELREVNCAPAEVSGNANTVGEEKKEQQMIRLWIPKLGDSVDFARAHPEFAACAELEWDQLRKDVERILEVTLPPPPGLSLPFREVAGLDNISAASATRPSLSATSKAERATKLGSKAARTSK